MTVHFLSMTAALAHYKPTPKPWQPKWRGWRQYFWYRPPSFRVVVRMTHDELQRQCLAYAAWRRGEDMPHTCGNWNHR